MSETQLVNMHLSDEYDINIGRPGPWSNPWTHLDGTLADFKVSSRAVAIDRFKQWLQGDPDLDGVLVERRRWILDNIEQLRGKRLGCWCHPKPCHGEVLIEMLEESEPSGNLDDDFR